MASSVNATYKIGHTIWTWDSKHKQEPGHLSNSRRVRLPSSDKAASSPPTETLPLSLRRAVQDQPHFQNKCYQFPLALPMFPLWETAIVETSWSANKVPKAITSATDSVPGSSYEVQALELSFVGAGSHHKNTFPFCQFLLWNRDPTTPLPGNQEIAGESCESHRFRWIRGRASLTRG